jgi:transposase
MADQQSKRTRRSSSEEFKAGAVRLVLEEGKTVGAAARDLDLTESSLRKWVEHARADRTKGKTGLTTAEREELARLRKELRIVQEVYLHRGAEGRAYSQHPLSVSARDAQWFLRLAQSAGIDACP